MKREEIKYIIFDLGGVIINLDPQLTIQQFARLANMDQQKVQQLYLHDQPFQQYEMGLLSDKEFRAYLREITNYTGEDNELDKAWNAMLLDIPPERLLLLKSLKRKYKLFLLSNTNAIHLECFNNILTTRHQTTFDQYFDHLYYSHLMNKRKPNADIFEQVLTEQNILPHQVLFIDDNKDNILGASNLGIQTLHITAAHTLTDFFHEEKH